LQEHTTHSQDSSQDMSPLSCWMVKSAAQVSTQLSALTKWRYERLISPDHIWVGHLARTPLKSPLSWVPFKTWVSTQPVFIARKYCAVK